MSQENRCTGEITISPPLSLAEIEVTPWHDRNSPYYDKNLKLHVMESPIEGTPGAFIRTAVGIIPATDDSANFYYVEEELNDILNIYDKYNTHTFTGSLVLLYENSQGATRFTIANDGNHYVRTEEARFLWPDGTPVNA